MNNFLTIVLEYIFELFIASLKIAILAIGFITTMWVIVLVLMYAYAVAKYITTEMIEKYVRKNINNSDF